MAELAHVEPCQEILEPSGGNRRARRSHPNGTAGSNCLLKLISLPASMLGLALDTLSRTEPVQAKKAHMAKDEVPIDDAGLRAIEAALQVGGFTIYDSADFNKAFDHITVLLEDAVLCLEHNSLGTSVFLAITAIEETAKIHVAMFRRSGGRPPTARRSDDPLYSHRKKHTMAVLPTVFMAERLVKAIGAERCVYLQKAAVAGKLTELRESALYVHNAGKTLLTPKDVISADTAREMLLLSIEVLDDALVGYTNHSMERSRFTDTLFARVRDRPDPTASA